MIRVVYAPDFVEDAVLLVERSMTDAERRLFRAERDALYGLADTDARDKAFDDLHLRWFEQLGLSRTLGDTIEASLAAVAPIEDVRVLRGFRRADEGADLVDRLVPGRSRPEPIVVIWLRPSSALDAAAIRLTLDHELMHVRDMLDPAFGYERMLPAVEAALTETILRDRYRVLWDATIDGRLARAGRAADGVRVARWHEFEATFPMLGDRAREEFDAWFGCERPTHGAMIAFACAPVGASGG